MESLDVYIIKVPGGQECAACEELKKYEHVDWTARRDSKMEKRSENIDAAIEELDSIRYVQISDREFGKKVNDIAKMLKT